MRRREFGEQKYFVTKAQPNSRKGQRLPGPGCQNSDSCDVQGKRRGLEGARAHTCSNGRSFWGLSRPACLKRLSGQEITGAEKLEALKLGMWGIQDVIVANLCHEPERRKSHTLQILTYCKELTTLWTDRRVGARKESDPWIQQYGTSNL